MIKSRLIDNFLDNWLIVLVLLCEHWTKGWSTKYRAVWLLSISPAHSTQLSLLPSHVSVPKIQTLWSSNLIFLSDPVLHKAQLLISLSLPAYNRSILFLMGCTTEVWENYPRHTASPEIGGNSHRSSLGWVAGLFEKLLSCWPFLSYFIYQKSYQL